MRKTLLAYILFAVTATTACAQNVGTVFTDIPDSLFPYFGKAQRAELVSLKRVDPSSAASLHSSFGCEVRLDSLADDYLRLAIDSAMTMEMARLHSADVADSLYCLLRTVLAPEAETTAMIYDKAWKTVAMVDIDSEELTQRPDTMDDDTYRELLSLIEFPMVKARFEDNSTILLTLNAPLLFKDDRLRLERVFVQRKIKWDGGRFKKYK